MKTLERPAPAGTAGPVGARAVPLSLLVIAVPAVLGVIRLVVSLHRPFLSGGDAAFMELAVRQALRGRQLLGPYSRFGWNHPGPAVFYLFAPAYRLSASSSRSLFLSSWLLNTGSAVAVVAVVRHRRGETAARVVAAVVGVFLLLTTFPVLINPWNPSLLALPFLLMIVLAADAATGSTWSLVGALVAGSYLVQTHVGMLPVVAISLLAAVAGWTVARRRSGPRPAPTRPGWAVVAAGVVVLGVMWAGPVVDQLTHQPGNAGKMLAFFRHPPAGLARHHPLPAALAGVSNEATRPVLGAPAEGSHPAPGRVAALTAVGLLGIVVAAAARKRAPFAAALGAIGAAELVVAVLATTRVVGDLEPYLFAWTPALLVAPVAAAGLAAVDVAERRLARPLRSAAGRVTAAAVLVVGLLFGRGAVGHATVSYADSPDAGPAARLIEDNFGHDRQRVFRIRVIDGQFQMSSVLLRLARDGYAFRMTPPYGLYAGSTDRPAPPDSPAVVVGTAASPVPPGTAPLATVGPFVFWTELPPGA